MAWAFTTYLALKGISQLVKVPFSGALLAGLVVGAATYFAVRPMIHHAAPQLSADREGVNRLFTVPLIFAAALLSS